MLLHCVNKRCVAGLRSTELDRAAALPTSRPATMSTIDVVRLLFLFFCFVFWFILLVCSSSTYEFYCLLCHNNKTWHAFSFVIWLSWFRSLFHYVGRAMPKFGWIILLVITVAERELTDRLTKSFYAFSMSRCPRTKTSLKKRLFVIN